MLYEVITLGLSSVFLKNRLSFDFTYYNIVDENQIIDLPTSEASAFSSRKVNGNQYTTNGFEVMLTASPVVNVITSYSIHYTKLYEIITEYRFPGLLL